MGRKLIAVTLMFGLLAFSNPALAWWDCNWKYRIPITIQENSGSALTDYQVLITVDTQSLISAGKMKNDCSDIRFTYHDGSKEIEIPYWIESGCGTTSTKIWVKVPNIPASGTATVYMYYGNPSATSKSNGDQVFEFFDDFEDGIIDSSKWTSVSGATESSGVLRGEGGNQRVWACSVQSFNAPIIVEYRMRPESTGDFDSGIRVGNLYFISDTGSYGASPNICTNWCYPSGSQGPDTNFHIYRAIIQPSSQQLIDLTSGGSRSASYSYSSGTLCLIGDSDSSSRDTLYDWIRVRKYASSEPTVSIGSEEYAGLTNVSILQPDDGVSAKSDIVTIKAKGIFSRSECSSTLTVDVVITSPVSKTYSMTCSGSTCSVSLDLNDVLSGVGTESDALPVKYYVKLMDQYGTTKSSSSRTLYVRTSHNVTILEPTKGSIVLGTGFVVKAKSDSLLKISDCNISLPSGATVSKKVVSPEDRYCEIWVDLSNYCSSNTITFSVEMTNNASVTSTSETRTHTIYDPQIVVNFVSPTPSDGSSLSTRYLPIKVQVNKYPVGGKLVPTTRKFVFEINGVNYTIYGDEKGYAMVELFHKGTNPEYDENGNTIKSIHDLIGDSSGTIKFRVYGLGRCGYSSSTNLTTVTVPPKVFSVNYVNPTPSDGSTLNILFMELKGDVSDNILAEPKCELWISKDNGYSWIKLKDLEDCYGYIVNDEFDLNNLYYDAVSGKYVLKYKIKVIDSRWGESAETSSRTVYIVPTAEEVPTVNPGMTSENIQATVSAAIQNNKPGVVFKTGLYKVNIVIDAPGKNFRLIGAGSILTPDSKGFPVITVKSGNVTIDRITIRDALFNVRVLGGDVKMERANVYGGLYGVEVKGGNFSLEDAVINAKLAGVRIDGSNKVEINNVKAFGKVWGAYLNNVNNARIEDSSFEGKVFGVYLKGNSNNNVINNVSAKAKVFGILIDSGTNNTIRNSRVYAKVFGIKLPGGNTIDNVIIDGVKVFGIYSPQPNNISNVLIKQAKVFGAYMTGNATNITILNSKLGICLFGSGNISYLTLGDTTINVTYSGSVMLSEKDPRKHPSGYTYTGQAFNKLGNGVVNATFVKDSGAIFHVLGGQLENLASGNYVEARSVGIYALYK